MEDDVNERTSLLGNFRERNHIDRSPASVKFYDLTLKSKITVWHVSIVKQ